MGGFLARFGLNLIGLGAVERMVTAAATLPSRLAAYDLAVASAVAGRTDAAALQLAGQWEALRRVFSGLTSAIAELRRALRI